MTKIIFSFFFLVSICFGKGDDLFSTHEKEKLKYLKSEKHLINVLKLSEEKENTQMFYSHLMIEAKKVANEYKKTNHWKELDKKDHEKMFNDILEKELKKFKRIKEN